MYIMCPPHYFGVNYTINPYMKPTLWHGREKYLRMSAMPLWKELRDRIEKIGGGVRLVPAQKELPDMCFAANAGLIMNGKVLLSNFKHAERKAEEPYWHNFFKDFNYDVVETKWRFEGEGDCKWDEYHNCFWMGHGQRSDPNAMIAVSETFEKEVIDLKLVDPRFYHLDLAFCPLSKGHLVWHPGAFDLESRQKIEVMFPAIRRYELSSEQMAQFSGNMVELLYKTVVLSYADFYLAEKLSEWGYTVIEIPLDPFHFAGGSAACLVLKVHTA